MAKEILRRLYHTRQFQRRAQGICGGVLFALVVWVGAGWAAAHGSTHLGTLRMIWALGLVGAAAGAIMGWRAGKISFDDWVVREERACAVPQLWATVIGVPPENPFFARLDADSDAALRLASPHFRKAAALRWFLLLACLAAMLAAGWSGRQLLAQPKIQMALGELDDSIVVDAPATIARGDAWTLRVHTLQAGPWTVLMEGGMSLPLVNGTLSLQSLRVGTKYRVATAWGESSWKTVSVYDPVVWQQLRLAVTPPGYLQLPSETLDLKTIANGTIVAGSHLMLQGIPGVEWTDPGHRNPWVAKADENDRLRPVKDGRHGAWAALPVRVVPDAPPEVRWILPERDVSWGERKTKAKIEASDDWNVCRLELRIRRLGEENGVTLELYRGRDRQRTAETDITPALVPGGAEPGIYELTPVATDSAGQTTAGENRFLEVKPDQKQDMAGAQGKAEHTSLRGLIVALLDTLRDWKRDGREARLGRVRLELDAMAAVAETDAFRTAAERWIGMLRDDATPGEVETVVQEMVKIQQKGEKSPPPPATPPSQTAQAQENASTADLEKIETLQRAAMDGSISPQLRENLQKQVQEQFGAKAEALKNQLPGDSGLIREMGMNQEKLVRQWSEDLAKTHLQELALLKAHLGGAPANSAGSAGPSQQLLLQGVKAQAEGGQAVSDGQLSQMHELSSQDSKVDWPAIAEASEKWNRALQSGLPSLQGRTKESLLREIGKNEPAPQGPPSFSLANAMAKTFGEALSLGDWSRAERLARLAEWTPAMVQQIARARNAPAAEQGRLKQELFAEMVHPGVDASQPEVRQELEKIMPIDPSWEPTVDKYFEDLNKKEPGP